MPKMSEIRAKFPMYDDVPDDQLLIGLHKKYYSDIPIGQFSQSIERDTERAKMQKQITDDMGFTGQVAAGAGKILPDLWRTGKRVANMVGIGDYDQKAAQEDADIDAPLMKTAGGLTGNVGGEILATAIPALRLAKGVTKGVQTVAKGEGAMRAIARGAAPYVGAATAGAGTGAALSPSDMSRGAAIGAVSGAGGELVGRVLPAAWGAVKGGLEPFSEKGRDRIVKRVLEGHATDPTKVAAVAGGPENIMVQGSKPTLGEATLDPGIASLERQFPQQMAERYTANNAARVGALESLGATPEKLAVLKRARAAEADSAYGPVLATADKPITESLSKLMQRPAMKDALAEGRKLAENLGEFPEGGLTVAKGLHYTKMALDKAFKTPNSSLASHGQRALATIKNELMQELEHFAPGYGAAASKYADLSSPIAAAEVGNELFKRSTRAMPNAAGDLPLQPTKLAEVLRNGDAFAQNVTGFDKATLEGTLGKAGVAQAQAVAADAARAAAMQSVGAGVGSSTAQNLAVRNLLKRISGPMGMPDTWLDSQVGNMLSAALGLPGRLTKDATQEVLLSALSDPRTAARIMATKDPRGVLEIMQPYVAQAVSRMSADQE